MKKPYILAAVLLLPTLAYAAPAQVTGRPYDIAGRPTDPQAVFCVNLDGSSSGCSGGGAGPAKGAVALGYQQISASTMQSAQSLTIPTGATTAVIEPEAGAVRWRDDGTAPTATVGNPIYVGQQLTYSASDLTKISLIDQDANGILNVSYYK